MLQQVSTVFMESAMSDTQTDFMDARRPAQPLHQLFACAYVFTDLTEQSERGGFNAIRLCRINVEALLHGGN